MYEMTGLSFREYLLMTDILHNQTFQLSEIINNHVSIATQISGNIAVLKHFKDYLKTGFYPYFMEEDRNYTITLEQVVRTVLENDLRIIDNFDVAQSRKMLTLLKIIAASAPFKPNISKISQKTDLHRQTVLLYLQYLEKARMIRLRSEERRVGKHCRCGWSPYK